MTDWPGVGPLGSAKRCAAGSPKSRPSRHFARREMAEHGPRRANGRPIPGVNAFQRGGLRPRGPAGDRHHRAGPPQDRLSPIRFGRRSGRCGRRRRDPARLAGRGAGPRVADSQQRWRPGERVQVPRPAAGSMPARPSGRAAAAGGAVSARLGLPPDGLQPGTRSPELQSQHRRQQPRVCAGSGLRLVADRSSAGIDEAAGPAIDPVGVEQVAQPVGRPVPASRRPVVEGCSSSSAAIAPWAPAGGSAPPSRRSRYSRCRRSSSAPGSVPCRASEQACGVHQVGSAAGLQRADSAWCSSISARRAAIMSSGRCRRSRAISAWRRRAGARQCLGRDPGQHCPSAVRCRHPTGRSSSRRAPDQVLRPPGKGRAASAGPPATHRGHACLGAPRPSARMAAHAVLQIVQLVPVPPPAATARSRASPAAGRRQWQRARRQPAAGSWHHPCAQIAQRLVRGDGLSARCRHLGRVEGHALPAVERSQMRADRDQIGIRQRRPRRHRADEGLAPETMRPLRPCSSTRST